MTSGNEKQLILMRRGREGKTTELIGNDREMTGKTQMTYTKRHI